MNLDPIKTEKDLFLWRTLVPLVILVPTLVMLWQAHYPGNIFWGIAVPVYLALASMAFAGARRFALRLELDPSAALLISASSYVSAGLLPLAYLLWVYRGRKRETPPPTPLDCRMPVIIDGQTYRAPGGAENDPADDE